jgi:hypothetical protein
VIRYVAMAGARQMSPIFDRREDVDEWASYVCSDGKQVKVYAQRVSQPGRRGPSMKVVTLVGIWNPLTSEEKRLRRYGK